jgi:hypothetical protein
MVYFVGWLGVPGDSDNKSTLTHLFDPYSYKAACGTKFSKRMEFQWCCGWGIGDEPFYVPECEKCCKYIERKNTKYHLNKLKKLKKLAKKEK